MNTTEKTAYANATDIAKAKAQLEKAKKTRCEAEKTAEAARETEHIAAGLVAVAIAKAIKHGADPVLVLPDDMLTAHRDHPRIIATKAELTMKRISNSLSIQASRFPGWSAVTQPSLRDGSISVAA